MDFQFENQLKASLEIELKINWNRLDFQLEKQNEN